MARLIGSKSIGGGYVNIPFWTDGKYMPRGRHLSAEQINAFVNREAMIRREQIAVYPLAANASDDTAERHVVYAGGGKFNVIAGRKLNDKPLSKEEAEALASD